MSDIRGRGWNKHATLTWTVKLTKRWLNRAEWLDSCMQLTNRLVRLTCCLHRYDRPLTPMWPWHMRGGYKAWRLLVHNAWCWRLWLCVRIAPIPPPPPPVPHVPPVLCPFPSWPSGGRCQLFLAACLFSADSWVPPSGFWFSLLSPAVLFLDFSKYYSLKQSLISANVTVWSSHWFQQRGYGLKQSVISTKGLQSETVTDLSKKATVWSSLWSQQKGYSLKQSLISAKRLKSEAVSDLSKKVTVWSSLWSQQKGCSYIWYQHRDYSYKQSLISAEGL